MGVPGIFALCLVLFVILVVIAIVACSYLRNSEDNEPSPAQQYLNALPRMPPSNGNLAEMQSRGQEHAAN